MSARPMPIWQKPMEREYCKQGTKTYFLKASELNDKFTSARKYGHEAHMIQFLVKPTCLITDEVGRCRFNRDDTAMLFDLVDRRYEKEGATYNHLHLRRSTAQ